MRRVIVLVLALALLSTGCGNSAIGTAPTMAPTPENTISGTAGTASPAPSIAPSPTDNGNGNMENQWSSGEAAAALAAYKSVLENQSAFYCIESKRKVLFDDFLINEEIYVTVFEPVKFTILDMDGDKVPEVVIALLPADLFEVLHYNEGEIEGKICGYRTLGQLKADGTLHWSNSAFNTGYGKFNFESAHDYRIDDLGYMDVEENNGAHTMVYYIDNTPVTKNAYDSFFDEQEAKPDATWHAFSQENIDAAF